MSYSKITGLIELWGEYEKLHLETSYESFGLWLSNREKLIINVGQKKEKLHFDKWKSEEEALKFHKNHESNAQIGMLLGRLSKFGRLYAKKALAPLQLNLDEFGFLASILHLEAPKKSEVININLFEPTTGTEILRRLIKLKYVNEFASKEDKRSKLLHLTAKGEKVLFKAFNEMTKVGTLVSANLTENQKNDMVKLMDYLNDFHVQLYLKHKDDPIEDCIKKFIS